MWKATPEIGFNAISKIKTLLDLDWGVMGQEFSLGTNTLKLPYTPSVGHERLDLARPVPLSLHCTFGVEVRKVTHLNRKPLGYLCPRPK